MTYAINCLALSDALDSRTIRIREDVDSARQTIARLSRMLDRVEKAALKKCDAAELDLLGLKDSLYTILAEHEMSAKDWEK